MSDLISRQDAIDALGDEPEVWNDTDAEWAERDAWVVHKVAIEALPSADRPTGEWVDDCTCSICHWMHEDNNGFALITKYNYCPNCGTKMKGGTE